MVEKSNQLRKSQDEVKTLEASLEEAVLEDSERAKSQKEEIARLRKAVEDKEGEAKEVREILVTKDEQIQKLEQNIREHSAALNDHETFVETLNSQVSDGPQWQLHRNDGNNNNSDNSNDNNNNNNNFNLILNVTAFITAQESRGHLSEFALLVRKDLIESVDAVFLAWS